MSGPRPARLRAELLTARGTVVHVHSVDAPGGAATRGAISVSFPCPADYPNEALVRVILFNEDLGAVYQTDVPFLLPRPGDAMGFTFGAEPTRDQVTAQFRNAVAANLASLNEIVTELTAAVSDDPDFVAMVRELLRGHSYALGYRPHGEEGKG